MPLWLVYHPEAAFVSTESKRLFAKDITSYYTKHGLPAFYVVVNFVPTPTGSSWVGGEIPEKPFVRITTDHFARQVPPEAHARVMEALEALMKPHLTDKGYDHEFNITQSGRDLWRINGLVPPPLGSEDEKMWVRLNKPVPYEGKVEESQTS